MRGPQQFEAIGIFEHRGCHARRELIHRFTVGRCPIDDLVVDIGDVAGVIHVIANSGEPSRNHVERRKSAGIADVKKIMHGGTAKVHANFARFDGG